MCDDLHTILEKVSVMLVVRDPMNFIDFNLTEWSTLDLQDLFEEFFFCEHVVPIVLAAQNLERLEHVMDVCW